MGRHGVKQLERKRTLFGADITAQVTLLDEGVHVLLTGGGRSHVGAVALAENGKLTGGAAYPGHREGQVAERWAAVLSGARRVPVTVACGIHYDNATRGQIDAVLQTCEALLEETLQGMKDC